MFKIAGGLMVASGVTMAAAVYVGIPYWGPRTNKRIALSKANFD